VSADLPGLHVDVNAGPLGIGAGRPQWFLSLGGSRGFGPAGAAIELFEFTAGGAGARVGGVLGAITLRITEWALVDAGGVVGTTAATQDQVFVGLTTNLGRIF